MSLQSALIILFFQICLRAVVSEKLIFHSFQPPFEEVDATGDKIVPHWRSSGTTAVSKNFIRLTPDRQSKKGALWSRRGLGVPVFSSILKFRISGQGKSFFGDGLALWITHTAFFNEGELHGSEEKFYGVAIIFDTFKNTENLAAHRDVTVLVNDGTKTYDMMIEDSHEVVGCNTNIRYHAERGDFSVNDATRAKVFINGSSLVIQMDPKNKGEWTDCVKVDNLGLPEDWATAAYIGLTATTGQLADNHDLISLQTYSDSVVMEMEESQNSTSLLVVDDLAPPQKNIQLLTDAVNTLIKKLDTLDHHAEHKFVDVYDHIKTIVGKLAHKEEDSEERIALLETLVQKTVGQSVHPRLSSIESHMHGVVDRKFMNMEEALDKKLLNAVEEKATEIKKSEPKGGITWHWPFALLLLLVIGASIAMWMFYQKIRKMHLL